MDVFWFIKCSLFLGIRRESSASWPHSLGSQPLQLHPEMEEIKNAVALVVVDMLYPLTMN